jgi:hypothetical protein
MARRLDEQYLTPRRAGIADILRRAIAAGQLRADTDVDMTIDLMVGAAVYRWLVTAQPVDADAARRGRRPARTPPGASSTRSGTRCNHQPPSRLWSQLAGEQRRLRL